MIDLAQHIEYLLMGHDCVVVPGLGAFLVHETAAFYDAERGVFMPPVCSLGFNQAITINDGLLVESVARRDGISLDEARRSVENAVASFRHQLASAHSLPVGNIGTLSEEEDVLLFEPSTSSCISMRYAGLRPLAISPIAEDSVESPEVIAPVPVSRPNIVPLPLKIAASVIILMIVCGVFYATDSLMGDRPTYYASLDSGLRAQPVCHAIVEDDSLDVSREILLNIALPAHEASTADKNVQRTDGATPGRYLLVVASFPSMKSALRHMNGDDRLSVVEMDGNCRVYAASASTKSEAQAKADSLREEFPSVWICRR